MNTNCMSELLKNLTARHGAMLKAISVTHSPTCNTSQVATAGQIGHTHKTPCNSHALQPQLFMLCLITPYVYM